MSRIALLLAWAVSGAAISAATLEKLTLDDMIQKSTGIVRGRVLGSWGAAHGPMIYTHFRIQVIERWKGAASASEDVVVPGGVVANRRQVVAGAPRLMEGTEYVLFLWTSRTGLTHVVGLSQGALSLQRDSKGQGTVMRLASRELMLNQSGQVVQDEAIRMSLAELATRIRQVLATARE
jgi:hypothetical protein